MQIHHNIPIPKGVDRRTKNDMPFVDLHVGGSFFVPIGEDRPNAVVSRVRTRLYRWQTRADLFSLKFVVTKTNDPITGMPAVGVWRTR